MANHSYLQYDDDNKMKYEYSHNHQMENGKAINT